MQAGAEDADDDSHMCLRCHAIIQGLEAYVGHRKGQCSRGLRPGQHETTTFPPGASLSAPSPTAVATNAAAAHRASPRPASRSSLGRDPLLAVTGAAHHQDPHGDKGGDSDKLLSDLVGPVMSADEFMSHLGLSIVTPSAWAAAAAAADDDMHPGAAAADFFSSLELQSIAKLRPAEAARPAADPPSPAKKSPQHDHEWAQLSTPHKRLSAASPGPEEMQQDSGTPPAGEPVALSPLSSEPLPFPAADAYPSLSKLFGGSSSQADGEDLERSSPGGGVGSPVWPTVPVQSAPSIIPSRGKWMPGRMNRTGVRKNGSRVQYFCESCKRRLSSRLLYERHLQSDYHAKRLSAPSTSAWTQPAPYRLRSQQRPGSDDEADSWDEAAAHPRPSQLSAGYRPAPQRPSAAQGDPCETCRAWIPCGMLGKHLISRFHVARSQSHARHQQLVLQHMPLIVREALYQCRRCRFYCHNRASFLQHWASDSHGARDEPHAAYFCGLCRRVSDSSALMGQHLLSAAHRQAEEIVSQAVPIIVQPITLLPCPAPGCRRKFRLHFQVNRHLAQCHGRQVAAGQVQRSNQAAPWRCEHCDWVTTSRALFTHHVHRQHPERPQESRYRCLLCGGKFATKAQAVQHRSSQEHRDRARHSKWGEQRRRKCQHCYAEMAGMAELKQHMAASHPALLPRCPSCGLTFAIKQQLSAHRRAGCQGARGAPSSPSALPGHACPHCPFATPALADLLFHRGVQHSDLLKERISVPAGKVACPECHHCYTQPALKKHVVVHTSERPHACRICGRRFASPADLQTHRQHLHQQTLVTPAQAELAA